LKAPEPRRWSLRQDPLETPAAVWFCNLAERRCCKRSCCQQLPSRLAWATRIGPTPSRTKPLSSRDLLDSERPPMDADRDRAAGLWPRAGRGPVRPRGHCPQWPTWSAWSFHPPPGPSRVGTGPHGPRRTARWPVRAGAGCSGIGPRGSVPCRARRRSKAYCMSLLYQSPPNPKSDKRRRKFALPGANPQSSFENDALCVTFLPQADLLIV